MTTTSRLIVLACFMAGSAFGYCAFFNAPSEELTNSTKPSAPTARRAPQIKVIYSANSSALPLPSGTNNNNLYLRYARLSAQETKNEILRIFDDAKSKEFLGKFGNYPDALACLSYNLGYNSPEEAKLLMESTPDLNKTAFLEGWAEKNFQEAMDYLLSHKADFESAQEAFTSMTVALVQKDPDKALQWLSTLTPGERKTALKSMSDAFPRNHPEKMAAFMALVTPHDIQANSLFCSSLASSWALTDWESAKTWSNSLNDFYKERFLSSAFLELSRNDLGKATKELKDIDKSFRDSIASAILYAMPESKKLNGKALDWVLENKDQFTDTSSIMTACLGNSSYQTPELTQKVLSWPQGELKDSALHSMANVRSTIDASKYAEAKSKNIQPFDEILNLASQIGNSGSRNYVTNSCVESWIRLSPEDAGQWIMGKSQFSDQDKRKFLQKCEKRKKEMTSQNF